MSDSGAPRLARREAVKLLAALAATPTLLSINAFAGAQPLAPANGPRGTATDPDLVNPVVPWELTLSEAQLATLAFLCDIILPADDHSVSASAIGAHHFIDEWISSPYENMNGDKPTIVDGLAWIDEESNRRFAKVFSALDEAQSHEICDDICDTSVASDSLATGIWFFDKVRKLAGMAFYTTQAGLDDLGYVGNVPLPEWHYPPQEALAHVGLKINVENKT